MAEQAKRAEGNQGGRKGGGSRAIVTVVLMLPIAAILLPTVMVLLSGMMPSVVAYLVDRTRAKHQAIAVGLLNLCGTVPGLVELWRAGQAYDVAAKVATDPFFWLVAYGAAAIGLLIFLSIPPVMGAIYVVSAQHRVAALRRRQSALIRIWGEEVASAPEDDEA